MKQINYKKLIPEYPYVFFVYLFDKVGQAAACPRRGYFCKDT